MARTGRPKSIRAEVVAVRIPPHERREMEEFVQKRGIRLSTYCYSLVHMGFAREKAAA